jgi:uncharacterized protein (TIGR04255 family)
MLMFNSCSRASDRTKVPLQLPEPDQTRLPHSPLDLVVCQLRFENQPRASEPVIALGIRDALGGEERYPRLDQVQSQGFNMLVGSSIPPAIGQTSAATGWRLQSGDGQWVVSVMPDHIALETTRYEGWEEFRERMVELVEAAGGQLEPGIEQRLGLRYIDRITAIDSHAPADWQPYLAPELLGMVLSESLGGAVTAAREQLLLDLGEGFTCTFTHGFLPGEGGRIDYLLDYDLSREGGRPFVPDGVRGALETLHLDALKLFHASVTPALLDILREPVAA